ncbi:MAG: hypothetical protein MUC96_15935, partial [Myxococcaceae bacterium]|nr:hypothetical protein [Myxococcaceae bacterium]
SEIVLKALARPTADRFQTAFELDKALATFVLRAAKSVEDSSVSLFMQQVYRDELAAEEGERLGTPVGTPAVQRGVVPQASSFGFGDTLAVDRSNELARARPTMPSGAAGPVAGSNTPAPRSEPMRTDQMPAAPLRTDQMPAVSGRTDQVPLPAGRLDSPQAIFSTEPIPNLPGVGRGPVRTDLMPAHRPSQSQPVLAVGTTDVVARDKVGQPKTDPEKHPLGAEPLNLDNSTVRVSDSVKLDVQRRIEEHRAAIQPPKAHEPTVLKPRAIAIDLPTAEPQTSPTTPAVPPPTTRSPAVIGVSVVIGLLVLGGGAYALVGGGAPAAQPAAPPAVAEAPRPVEPPAPTVEARPAVEPKPIEPAALPPAPEEKPDAPTGVVQTPPPDPPVRTTQVLEPVAVPAPAPEPERPVAAPTPKPVAAAVRFGTVSIKAVPFAEITVDGRKMGEAQGIKQLKLPFGTHKVTLVHPKRSETFTISVDGKGTPELSFNANQ